MTHQTERQHSTGHTMLCEMPIIVWSSSGCMAMATKKFFSTCAQQLTSFDTPLRKNRKFVFRNRVVFFEAIARGRKYCPNVGWPELEENYFLGNFFQRQRATNSIGIESLALRRTRNLNHAKWFVRALGLNTAKNCTCIVKANRMMVAQ
jgi:hypothetical protein